MKNTRVVFIDQFSSAILEAVFSQWIRAVDGKHGGCTVIYLSYKYGCNEYKGVSFVEHEIQSLPLYTTLPISYYISNFISILSRGLSCFFGTYEDGEGPSVVA